MDAFADYLADLDAFVAKLSQDGVAREQLFVVAHSQGALVARARGGSRAAATWRGFVLSSPYFRLALRPPLAKLLGGAARRHASCRGCRSPTGLDVADLTTRRRAAALDRARSRSTGAPRRRAGSTRPARAQARGAARARASSTAPLLVLAAGADRIADVAAARAFVDAAGSADKRLEVYAGFRHEIFNEVERERPIAEAVAWLPRALRVKARARRLTPPGEALYPAPVFHSTRSSRRT